MKREDLKFPFGTYFMMGAKLGRFSSACISALVPGREDVLVVAEVPNYHYVGDGEIELLGLSPTQWAEKVVEEWKFFEPARRAVAIIGEDDAFDKALKRTKLSFAKNMRRKPEVRTEVTREFFEMKRVYLTPWLTVLPYELYKAKWPPEASGRGNERVEGQDYTLTGLEHVLSRRPRPKKVREAKRTTFVQQIIDQQVKLPRRLDSHMGSQ